MQRPRHSLALALALLAASACDTSSHDESDHDTGSETETETGEPWMGDCAALPPVEVTQLAGPIAAADVAFDREGHLIGSNTLDIFRASSPDEQAKLWVPGVVNRSAVRMLSNGRIAVVQEDYRRVLTFGPAGDSALLAANLYYPFGLVEDLQGRVYVGDSTSIVRVELESGDIETWLDTPDFVSRWMSFDRTYESMFVGGRSPTIVRVPIDEAGAAGLPSAWGTLPVEGDKTLVDGLGVDACGNVYAAEFWSRALYRFAPEGGMAELLVQWDEVEYGHGLQWGSGVGPWSETSLYLPQPYNEYNVVRVEIGVPNKPMPLPH